MNGKQAIQENVLLREVEDLLNVKVQNVDVNFSVDESLALYIEHVKAQNIRTLLTVALIKLKKEGFEGDVLRLKLAETLEKALVTQTEKGLMKYSNTVNPSDYSVTGWLEHALEELVDTTVYLSCVSEVLKRDDSENATIKKATS